MRQDRCPIIKHTELADLLKRLRLEKKCPPSPMKQYRDNPSMGDFWFCSSGSFAQTEVVLKEEEADFFSPNLFKKCSSGVPWH